MVRLEAVLISALGTVTGIILGLFIGWGLIYSINRLSDADISFSVPGRTLAIVLVMGIVLGGLASLVPARRSTKLDVLEAIQAT
jgi:putative ABC transport system permease protein